MTPSVRAFCEGILASGRLADKLAPAPAGLDPRPGGQAPLFVDRPAREPELALERRAPPLPRPAELGEPAARSRALARFAHHELMAVELFAWALLRWPEAPAGLRASWLGILADEQRHCRLYVDRLTTLDSELGEHPASDYFWRHAPAIADSPHGPRAFLAAMGLTLEQANLDFSATWAEAFAAAGDADSARVSWDVHRDEIRHVSVSSMWLARMAQPGGPGAASDHGPDDAAGARAEIERYTSAVPFPLSAARAKGRRFRAEPRRRAGLSEGFIEFVRTARSSQETGRRRGPGG